MKCYVCKNDTITTETELERKFGKYHFSASVPCERCSMCGEETVSDADLKRFELAVAAKLASTGISSGAALVFQRKAIGLSGKDLAVVLGVTPETVSRWENDKVPPDRTAVATLGTLVREALLGVNYTREQLAALASPTELPSRISLGTIPVDPKEFLSPGILANALTVDPVRG